MICKTKFASLKFGSAMIFSHPLLGVALNLFSPISLGDSFALGLIDSCGRVAWNFHPNFEHLHLDAHSSLPIHNHTP